MHVPKRTLAVAFLALAAATSIPRPAWAVVPVQYPPPLLTPMLINGSAGDQNDPHVSGDWASYTDRASLTSFIRYYRFSTFTDAAIPLGPSARDELADVSGSRIVFSHIIPGKTAVMVFDAATGAAPIEIDPTPGSLRLGSAIGGDTVAFVDFMLEGNGEMVIHDLATSTSVRMTFDTEVEQSPSVSPAGDIVVWEHCVSTCSILQAVKTGGTWGVSLIAPDASYNPDTNGTLVVYDSTAAGGADVFWRPSAGGPEVQLEWPDFQRNPSIAGDFIAFEGGPTMNSANDLFVYDIVNNRLFPITDTPLVNEQLNDITVLPDGRLRLVWAGNEDGNNARNVWSATFQLPNIASTLAHSTEPGYGTDGVSPDAGTTATSFTYKVVYSDFEGQAPSYLDVCIDGTCHGMTVDTTAAGPLQDGDHRNGEQYAYATTLAGGPHAYRFEASDGTDTARLPSTGTLAGPSVSDPTPPVLHVPATITVNATSPSGAVVTFVVTATDPEDPNPIVACVPASGSTFAIGATTVTCTATNASGGQSTASFDVVVKGAAAQIADLIALVLSFNLQHGIENSLDAKLQNVLAALNAVGNGSTATACNKLNAFINEVQAQSGQAITVVQAGQLIAACSQVKAALGCP